MEKTNKTDNSLSVEGNILISEFVGESREWNDSKKGKITLYCHVDPSNPNCEAHELKYHESWDKLMQVVEIIEKDDSIAFMILKNGWDNRGCIQVSILKCFDMKENRERKPIIQTQGSSKIKTTWQAVVDFIQWYNKNKV